MKNTILIIISTMICLISHAQSPALFNYQGVARDANNQPLANQNISLKISILENASNGSIIYSEKHNLSTTPLGVFSLQVGDGTNQFGDILMLDWSNNNHWLQIEMDENGGSNYKLMGSSQLVSVPYAMHAETVTNSDDADADPTNEIQQITFDVSSNILTLQNGGSIDLSTLDNDGGGTNSGTDDQLLSLNGTTLSIEDGNSVDLTTVQDGVNDADADPNNELQDLTKNGNVISLSNSNSTIIDEVNDADADPNNEIQKISKNGSTITLSNGGGFVTDQVEDADADPANELQSLSLNGDNLSISDGNQIDLSVIKDGVDDADADPTNEIQTLGFVAATNILTLSNGGQVDLSSLDNDGGGTGSGTDDQTLSINGTQLSIEDGNTVDLASIQDGVDDADANPVNELQDLYLQNDILSLSQSNTTIDLKEYNSPWVSVPQTSIIDYSQQDALARIKDGDKTINLAPNRINFLDQTECRTYLENGNITINREIPLGNDVFTVLPAATLDKNNISFTEHDDDPTFIYNANYGRDSAFLHSRINNIDWTNRIEAYQMDMRINDDEVWGNYDAFGFQGLDHNPQQPSIESELVLKTGVGLYMDSQEGQNPQNATLSNTEGYYLGEGLGSGQMDITYTKLEKDSLTFNTIIDNGLLTGNAAYGRDQMHMDFQTGGQFNSSRLDPFNFSFTNIENGYSNSMNLGHNYLEFDNYNFGQRFTHVGIDSIYISGSIGLLLPQSANLKPYGLTFDDFYNISDFTSRGLTVKESLSATDIFDRIKLVPDELSMFNNAKWQTVRLGTNMNDNRGELALYGNGNNVHTYIGGNDLDGSVIEMNYGTDLRAGMWSFEDYGLLNTMGKNGSQNTYVGPAQFHGNSNMGGMGVMDELGFLQAGMEVDEFGSGLIHSTGEISIVDDNANAFTQMDYFGFSMYDDNGSYILGMGRNFLSGGEGYYNSFGENGNLNFLSGSNLNFGGNSNTGFAAVYDVNGTEKAGLYVDETGLGVQFADMVSIGEIPTASTPAYSLIVNQSASYGISLKNSAQTANWEQYVDNMDRFTLYFNNTGKGYFDPVTGNYITFSDKRLKSDIQEINSVLSQVKRLKPSVYSYKENNPTSKHSLGFIAQEVQEIFPDLVQTSNEERSKGMLAVDYSGFTVVAIKAIQEQQTIIENQANEIEKLNSRLAKIEKLLGIE